MREYEMPLPDMRQDVCDITRAELEGAKTLTICRSSRSRREDFAGDRCAVCSLSSADPLPDGGALRGPKLEIFFHPPTLKDNLR